MIDGFDPDKFRKVNSKAQNTFEGISVERKTFGAPMSDMDFQESQMPGVPTYDNGEKQLLAALEQELGVL